MPCASGVRISDHLVFLARGDVALTRRAGKYSTLRAVVLRFSRSRKRYERQGILVEEGGIRKGRAGMSLRCRGEAISPGPRRGTAT